MSAMIVDIGEEEIEIEDPRLAEHASELRVFREMMDVVAKDTDGAAEVLHHASFGEHMNKKMSYNQTAGTLQHIATILNDTDFHSLEHCKGKKCQHENSSAQCRNDCLKGVAAGVHKVAELVCKEIFKLENFHSFPTSKLTLHTTLTGVDITGMDKYLPAFPVIRAQNRSPLEDAWAAFYGSILGAEAFQKIKQHNGSLHTSLDAAIPFSIFIYEAGKVVKELNAIHIKRKDIEAVLATLPEEITQMKLRMDNMEKMLRINRK